MNEVAKISTEVTEQQKNAWVAMASRKNELTTELANLELEAQGILLNLSTENFDEIDAAGMQYKAIYTRMQDTRKEFTGAITDAIIKPLMAFEKRTDPEVNPDFIEKVSKTSLRLRKAQEEKIATANAKNSEIAAFKTFVTNGYMAAVQQYRNDLRQSMIGHYNRCLSDKVADPGLKATKKLLSEIEHPKIGKFNAQILTQKELAEIFKGLQKPDWNQTLANELEEMDRIFSNYDSDLANTTAAIEALEKEQALKRMEEEKQLNEETAINTLISTTEVVTEIAPKIKRSVTVRVIESEQWAKSVMTVFMVNLPYLSKYIKAKWSKLSVGQMANYLGNYATETGDLDPKLTYDEIEK